MQKTAPTSIDPVARLAERQHWILPQAEQSAQDAIQSAIDSMGPVGHKLRSALHGEWLHQPLHSVITDVPIGAWTAAVVFDTLGASFRSEKMDAAADACVLLGLAGAAGAAVAGITDWAEIKQEAPRRIGAVHALLNIGATALFAASCLARRRSSSRSTARSLAALGSVVMSASAHLGGNLVYEHGIGLVSQKTAKD